MVSWFITRIHVSNAELSRYYAINIKLNMYNILFSRHLRNGFSKLLHAVTRKLREFDSI